MDEIDGIIGWAVEIPLLFNIIMIVDQLVISAKSG